VAVKVLYPGIERLIQADLFVLGLFLPIISRVSPSSASTECSRS
jgi:predicted unusual protein kinase regulating ubiquinone biosynthesis (AarF/ABC1/UbiB family)